MKKKTTVSFRHFDGAGPLSIYWYDGPFGDAIEADYGNGVGWFSPTGELLGAEFDNVAYEEDQQTLKFTNRCIVTVQTKHGRTAISHTATRKKRTAA